LTLATYSIGEPIGRVSGAVVEEHRIEGREALSHFVRQLGVGGYKDGCAAVLRTWECPPASKLVTGHRQCVTLDGTELNIPVYRTVFPSS
jgi:hypothetical protein